MTKYLANSAIFLGGGKRGQEDEARLYLSGQIRCFGADVCRMIDRSKSGVCAMLLFVVLPLVDFVTTASCKVRSLHELSM